MCWVDISRDMQMFIDMAGCQLVVVSLDVIVRARTQSDVMHNWISLYSECIWMWARCTKGILSTKEDVPQHYTL